ncbi:MAG: DUF126 domain-containing protein [Euryarchaeota archaeon]
MQVFKCRVISRGKARGKIIHSSQPLSFLGGVDPDTGKIMDINHPLQGEIIKNKILVIPGGKGSTVGSYVIFQMYKNNTAPLAIICLEAEPIIATGAIMAGIPMVDHIRPEVMDILAQALEVEVDGDNGEIKVFNH